MPNLNDSGPHSGAQAPIVGSVTFSAPDGYRPVMDQVAMLKLEQRRKETAMRRAVLNEAAAIVTGAREAAYGGPEQSFGTIADLWSVYLGRAVAPHDVAALLALLKLARIKHSGGQHRDSWVDLAGYAACGAECASFVREVGTDDDMGEKRAEGHLVGRDRGWVVWP